MEELREFGIELLGEAFKRITPRRKNRQLAQQVWETLEQMHNEGMEKELFKQLLKKRVEHEHIWYAEVAFKILKGLAFPSDIYEVPVELRKYLAEKLILEERRIENYEIQRLIDKFFGEDKAIIIREEIAPEKVKRLVDLTLKALKGVLDLEETYKYLDYLKEKAKEEKEPDLASLIEHLLKALKPTKRQRIRGEDRVHHGWFYYVYNLQLMELETDAVFLNYAALRDILSCAEMMGCTAIQVDESYRLPCTPQEKEILEQIAKPVGEREWVIPLERLGSLTYPFPPRGGNCKLLPSIGKI